MPAGLQVINNYGTVLIADTNPSLSLKEKRTVTIAANGRVTFSFTGVELPMLSFRCNTIVHSQYMTRSGSTITYTLSGAVGAVITLYLFDRPVPTTGSNAGLQVFDAAGRCTFDSSGKYGIIVASNPPIGSWIGTAGRLYAVCITSPYWNILHSYEGFWENEEHWFTTQAATGGRSITNGIEWYPKYNWDSFQAAGQSVPADSESGAGTILVLDVTGY